MRKKIFKLAVKMMLGLSLSILIMNSCEKSGGVFGSYQYDEICLGFRDASGNDIVNGIDYWCPPDCIPPDEGDFVVGLVNLESYTLDVIFPDPRMCPDVLESYGADDKRVAFYCPTLSLRKDNGIYYLSFLPFSKTHFDNKKISPAEIITLKLRCPYVFGDDAEHEIVTYWNNSSYNQECIRIDFDGKEYAIKHHSTLPGGEVNVAMVNIVLSN